MHHARDLFSFYEKPLPQCIPLNPKLARTMLYNSIINKEEPMVIWHTTKRLSLAMDVFSSFADLEVIKAPCEKDFEMALDSLFTIYERLLEDISENEVYEFLVRKNQ
jgi:hypothetical protein